MSSRPAALEALASNPATAGLVLDFDGVLSPIVENATTSTVPGPVVASLSQLAKKLGLLAVISGRPVDFLTSRIHIPGVPLLGSYGIEQFRDGDRWLDPEAKKWLSPVRKAGKVLAELLDTSSGVKIEEKPVSVAVHWRMAPNRKLAADNVRRVASQVADETGLRLVPGKFVEELRPPIEMDKGSAISSLISANNLITVAYAGDDLGDVPALRAVQDAGGYALVVEHGSETDSRLLQLADQTFIGTEEFATWLAKLVDAIGI
jgi:trehalose 6-phosphate phosphatase